MPVPTIPFRGQCCDAIFRHSLGRDDDNMFDDDDVTLFNCQDPNKSCDMGKGQYMTWSSSTGNASDGQSFVLVVYGLLGAAMIAMKVVQRRHRVLLRRHQYSEVDAATVTRMDV